MIWLKAYVVTWGLAVLVALLGMATGYERLAGCALISAAALSCAFLAAFVADMTGVAGRILP